MTDTLQVGDFVRRATGATTWWSPPRHYADAHFMVVGRNGRGDMLATLTPYHGTDPGAETFGVGWLWATRSDRTDLVDPRVLPVILDAGFDARGWMIHEGGVEKVPLDEVRVPQRIERLHRAVMAAVNGRAEPVLPCRRRSHPMREHRHSVHGSGEVMYRSPDETSLWTALPGLWARNEARSTDPSRVRDAEVEHGASPQWPLFECTWHVADHIGVHYHVTAGPEFDPFAEGLRLMWNPTVMEQRNYHTECGKRYARADLLTAENAAPCKDETHRNGVHHHLLRPDGTPTWEPPQSMHLLTGYTDLGLFARTTTTEGSNTMPSTTDNLHPITAEQLRENPHLRITSKPIGEARNDGSITFGCQTFTLRELRQARATITYGDRRATVTADGYVEDGYILIAGHTLGRADVNEYADTIVGITPPTPQYNAIVMEHGFYKCEADGHDHVIALMNGPDGPVVGYTDGNGGIVGQRDGLTGPSLRRCVPARYTSTTMQVMGFTRDRNFSAVPVTDGFDFTDRVGVKTTGDSVRNVRQDGSPL